MNDCITRSNYIHILNKTVKVKFFVMGSYHVQRNILGIVYLISLGVSSSSFFSMSFLQNTNQMMSKISRMAKDTPTTTPATTPIPFTSTKNNKKHWCKTHYYVIATTTNASNSPLLFFSCMQVSIKYLSPRLYHVQKPI